MAPFGLEIATRCVLSSRKHKTKGKKRAKAASFGLKELKNVQHVVSASFRLEMRGTAPRTWSQNNMQYIVSASVGLEKRGHSYKVCCVPKTH